MKKLLLISLSLYSFSFMAFSQSSWQWVKYGVNRNASSWNDGGEIGADTIGTVVAAGDCSGSIGFGPDSVSGGEIFLVKYDSNGNVLWTQGDILTAQNFGLYEDKTGNSFITGFFIQSVTFGSYTLTSPGFNHGVYFVKYNSAGTVQWAVKGIPTSTRGGGVIGMAICADNKGNSYLTAQFSDTIILSGHQLISNGAASLFIAKFDPAGNVIWITTSLTSKQGASIGNAITTDHSGNIYLTGEYYDTVAFGTHKITGYSGVANAFLVKYDSAGNALWATASQRPSSNNMASGNDVTTDISGNVYITGYFDDSISFNNYKLTSPQTSNSFIAKFDKNGNVIWAEAANLPSLYSEAYGYSIVADKLNHFYISGRFTDTIAFGSILLHSDSDTPAFLFEFDTSGVPLCGTFINDRGQGISNSLALNPSASSIYFSGGAGYEKEIIFGTDTIKGINSYSFVGKWEPCDNILGISNIASPLYDVEIYPNPSTGIFNIVSHSRLVSESQTIEVYNIIGEQVYSNCYQPIANGYQLSLSNQPNGVYLYRVIGNNGELMGEGKLIIQK